MPTLYFSCLFMNAINPSNEQNGRKVHINEIVELSVQTKYGMIR